MLLPVGYHLNSAYRSPKVNKAVGGAGGKCTRIQGDTGYSNRCSYHTSGLAADITPIGMTNKQLAVWMYENRKRFPHLDQVIWYTDTSHIHIGLDPARARAYKNLPGGWYYAKKEGSEYTAWKPGDITLAGLTGVGNTGLVVGALVAAAVAAGIYRYR